MGENFRAYEKHDNTRDTNTSHVWRYYLARGLVEPGDIVHDISCGWGYGSYILSRSQASLIRGFDSDLHALNSAKQDYGSEKVDFIEWDFDKIQGTLPHCDITISIETIEHLNDPEYFVRQIKLSTGRAILVTTPIVPTTQAALGDEKGSPYHHHDFTIADLNNLFIDKEWNIIGDAIIGQHGLVAYVKS